MIIFSMIPTSSYNNNSKDHPPSPPKLNLFHRFKSKHIKSDAGFVKATLQRVVTFHLYMLFFKLITLVSTVHVITWKLLCSAVNNFEMWQLSPGVGSPSRVPNKEYRSVIFQPGFHQTQKLHKLFTKSVKFL